VMERLVDPYGFQVNGAAGLVGNLWAESGVIPSRIEGSATATPMRAPAFGGGTRDFTADEVMNRNPATHQGPRLPGIGLAQWTAPARRAGLFQHVYQGRPAGSGILTDMDAQIDYLVTELQRSYAPVYRLLTRAGVTVNDAADAVVYRFEVPGSILQDGKRLPRTDHRVQAVFTTRRASAQRALRAYRAVHPATPVVDGGRMWRGDERDEDFGGLVVETTAIGRADAEQNAPALRLPAGKGMWTGNLAGAGTPAQMAAKMRDNGISWLAVHVLEIGGERRNPRRTLERYFTALRAELNDPAPGFWLWGWPAPGGHEAFTAAMVAAAAEVGAQGLIIDVEAEWKWRAGNAAREAERRAQATALMDRLLPAAHAAGLSVGFTSYGAPWFHRNFPWAQFTGADFSLPQIYDGENNQDVATFGARCDREWRALGFRALMPISNAYSKTAEQMRLLLRHTPVTAGAVSWWWWHAASTARWRVIRDYAVPPPPAPAPSPSPEADGDAPFPFLEELEAAEREGAGEMAEAAGPVTFDVGHVVPPRRFVDLPLTYEEWIDNADATGLVLRRTRCDTLAHVTAQGRIMPLGDDGTFEYAIPHADLVTSMSAVPMLWQTGAGGRLQAALDLVIYHPAGPGSADRLPPGRDTFPLVVICMGNHGVCSTTPSGAADPPTGALGPGGALPLRLLHAATFGAEVLSHHGYSAVTRGRPPGVTTGPASVPYLQEELAAHGMVSVSVSTNPANYFDLLLETRADLILAAVAEMRRQNADSSSRFHRRIDFDRVAFVGHSRGGDAVVRAAQKQRSTNVRALVQLAPTDITGLLRGRAPAGTAAGRTDAVEAPMSVSAGLEAFQLLVYGSRDGDVSGLQDVRLSEFGEPFRHYDRSSAHRSFLFWHGATHNRFNRFWEDADEEPLVNLAAGGLLGRPEQERRTSEAVGACLRFVLNRERAEADRLNGRAATAIAPGLPVAAMWKFGRSLLTIDRFEDARADRNTLGGRNDPPPGGLVDEVVLANENPPGAGISAFQFMHVDRVLRGSLPSSAPPGTGALTSG
ncbi:MAG TPA: phage tail tip lysozyme, partial [Longimicrobium sp.]